MTKGLVYYTDNKVDPTIGEAVRQRLREVNLLTVSVSLAPIDFGTNIVLPLERGYLTMFKQILTGLEALTTDIAYLVEHDVLYSPSHFTRTPIGLEYNQNVWKVDSASGRAVHYPCSQVSGLAAPRILLLEHYTKRVAKVEANGFTMGMGFEPGTHNRSARVDNLTSTVWMSEFPNVDIRHTSNLSKTKWSPSDFRNPRYAVGWVESDSIPGWGKTLGCFDNFLKDLST